MPSRFSLVRKALYDLEINDFIQLLDFLPNGDFLKKCAHNFLLINVAMQRFCYVYSISEQSFTCKGGLGITQIGKEKLADASLFFRGRLQY